MDRQHQAIKRLTAKQALKGEQLLEYIMGKLIDSNNKRAKLLWLEEFDKIFEALPEMEQNIVAYGTPLN